jgi:hypothetical protein
LSALTSLRDQLKARLSGATHEQENGARPSIPELAERIKALKTANSIKVVPQRVRQKQLFANEPERSLAWRRAAMAELNDAVHELIQALCAEGDTFAKKAK